MSTYTVGYIVGSLSSTSINRILATALIHLAPDDLAFVEIPIRNLPLYSQDYDADYPPEGRALKEAIAAVDAILFVTPEFNRSIPGALKNAIDWASRPWGQNSFDHLPAAVAGTSVRGWCGPATAAVGCAAACCTILGSLAWPRNGVTPTRSRPGTFARMRCWRSFRNGSAPPTPPTCGAHR
ncbi:MAG: NAD(P)H-dependent oxidoreductase [Rhodococcus sp. (in: high G+C Gram-positive bacteria)]|nr:MAG: NAD(P)H-dependent oxidoreductase [Rhodococcus sp. (in: high G+C Gram-positive bacteria)]